MGFAGLVGILPWHKMSQATHRVGLVCHQVVLLSPMKLGPKWFGRHPFIESIHRRFEAEEDGIVGHCIMRCCSGRMCWDSGGTSNTEAPPAVRDVLNAAALEDRWSTH